MHVIMEFTYLPALFLILCSLFSELWSYQSGFYADNGLQQTVLLNRLPHRQRKEMQQEILTLLGLHHRPKPSRHPKVRSAPQFMMDLYNSMEQDPENEHENRLNHKQLHVNISQGTARIIDTADMIMSFINQAPNHHFLRHDVSRRFLFDFSEVPAGEVVTAAEFRLFKQPGPGWLGHRYINIHVYRVRQGQDLEDRLLQLESNVTVKGEYRGWLELDVTRAAAEWNAYPTSNLGILVVVMDPDGNEVAPHRVGLVDYRGPEEKQPFMLACFKSYTTLHSRSKRSTRKRKRKNQEVSYNDAPTWDLSLSNERYNKRACQRRALYVSFRELGWQDWIIAPDGYGAFYCYGGCSFPLNAQMNATNHAIVQTLVHLMNPFYVPKPCCAPTELSAISVLFFDDKYNVVLKKYKNMVVEACGCH